MTAVSDSDAGQKMQVLPDPSQQPGLTANQIDIGKCVATGARKGVLIRRTTDTIARPKLFEFTTPLGNARYPSPFPDSRSSCR